MALAFAFGCFAGLSFAQQALEIIPLRHRTVEQVLPALQPLLEPGATLSGTRGQLFLRASPANAAEIRRALAALDQPAKRLQISVRLENSLDRARRDFDGSIRGGTGGVRAEASVQDARRSSDERVDQRLQVLEGSRAMISTGQSRPVVVPGATAIQDLTTGFEVVPRLVGREVVMEILQRRDSAQSQQAAATTLRAPLGQWVEIGSVAHLTVQGERTIGSATRVHRDDLRQIWVKVEELGN